MKPTAPAPVSASQCQVLLQLVSEQVLPNLLTVMALRPGRIIQVRNGDAAKNPRMETATSHFRHALQVLSQEPGFKGYHPKMVELNLPHLSPDLTSTRDVVANTLATTQGVTVNFTGGTRLMSIGAFQAAAALGRPSLFCDAASQRFSDGRTGGQGRWPEYAGIASTLSARLLMAVEGRNPDDWRSEPATDPLRAFGLKAFELRNQQWNILENLSKTLRPHFYTHGDKLPHGAEELKELTLKSLPSQATANEHARQYLAAAASAGLLRGDAQSYKLNVQPTKRSIDRALSLINSAWLELAVMDCLMRNPRFKEPAWSVELAKNEAFSDYNDTDLVCVDQNIAALRVISCKVTTLRPPQELLDAVKERAVRMGGLAAAATLVVFKPAPNQENAIRSYARRIGVDVALEADEIVKMFSPHATAKHP
ncbi:MAG: hypothetical protein JWO94_3266 [Verrucomicrobiaceae bacterium]|nr:hypothetical protein [Verrucomicrobiaceae bacterium]